MVDTPEIGHLVQIFTNTAAPAFLLGAIAAFLSLMLSRTSAQIDRLRSYKHGRTDDLRFARDAGYVELLKTRIRLLYSAVQLSLVAGIAATALLAVISGAEILGLRFAYGAGLLFLASNLALGAAMFRFAQEIWLGMHEMDFS